MRRSGMAGLGMAVVLLTAACMALAASPREMRKQVQASMLVTGRVVIETDGRVGGWQLDQRERLPEAVVSLLERLVPHWRFEPIEVDGQAIRGDARMSLRLVAQRVDDDSGDFRVSVEDGYFGRDALSWDERKAKGVESDFVRKLRMDPPRYPLHAINQNAQGTVYLVLRVNRDGRVQDAVAEQVNLRTLGSPTQLERMRELLARPALEAAREWVFHPPATMDADATEWTVRVPVEFALGQQRTVNYGEWNAYVPGPRHPVPWRDAGGAAVASPDTMVAGELYQDGAALTLRSPIGG